MVVLMLLGSQALANERPRAAINIHADDMWWTEVVDSNGVATGGMGVAWSDVIATVRQLGMGCALSTLAWLPAATPRSGRSRATV